MKFGLRNMRSMLRSAGNPERCFPSIHIAGTNGKGSTAAFIASMLMEAGYSVGLYTSPHLVRFTERIRINGREIPDGKLRSYVRRLKPSIESVRATFFEATTAVAFLWFADEEVDIAVVETGLGGRLDATNVLVPIVSVITNIGLDHTDLLGATITSIAREKGGIIKKGVPLVTATDERRALETLRRIARRRGAPFTHSRSVVEVRRKKGLLSFRSPALGLLRVRPGLAGEYQERNARLAVAVADRLLGMREFRGKFNAFGPRAVRQGLVSVVRNSGLHGRLERCGRHGEYLLDVAHNPAGIRALVSALKGRGDTPAAAVFGVMRDKDYAGMLAELSGIVQRIIPVAPAMKRALPVSRLKRAAARLGFDVLRGGTVRDGLHEARKMVLVGTSGTMRRGFVLVTGSHYVVGEAREKLPCRRGP